MYNQDVEEALIGALLIKPQMLDALPGLIADHFYFGDYADIFTEIKRQYETTTPNVLTVAATLPQEKRPILATLAQNVITTVNCPDYAATLLDLYTRRQLAAIATRITEGESPDLPQLLAQIEQLAEKTAPPLSATPLAIPATLPPRQWVYGVHLIKNYTSMTVAPAGAGKSTVSIMDALSIATGKPLLGQHVHSQEKVWLYNLEDPLEEMQRRMLGACQYHNLKPPAGLYMDSGRDRPLIIMEKSGSTLYAYPDKKALIKAIKKEGIGVLIVDPFISSYEGDENNNKDVDRAIKAFNAVASECNCAIELIHHTGKGTQEGANAGRGASAMVGAVRSLRTIVTMSEEEAEKYGVEHPRQYIRLDGAKSSMAPSDDQHRWMHLDSVELPNGDSVGVVAMWTPPSLMDGISRLDVQKCLEAIHAGRDGGRYGMTGRGGLDSWVGNPIKTCLEVDDERAKGIIAIWSKSGLIYEQEYLNESRKPRKGVFVNIAKMKEI